MKCCATKGGRGPVLLLCLCLPLASGCGSTLAPGTLADEVPATTPEVPVVGNDNPYIDVDIAKYFDGFDGTFVMYDINREIHVRHDVQRAATRFSPCSTFKIPNTLIGLETGILRDENTLIAWDPKAHPQEPWWDEILKPSGKNWAQDHTLATAFQQSVVWYYQELAKRVGLQQMGSYLSTFAYGNQDISGGIDRFWLSSSLLISADEQVAFLTKLVAGEPKVREETRSIAFKVFKEEETPEYVLYAKTGTGTGEPGKPGIGWYVGFVDRGDNTFVFAFNMAGDWQTISDRRLPAARGILTELGIISQ